MAEQEDVTFKNFGRIIREARKAKGWTLHDLWFHSKVHERTLSNYESGKVRPSPEIVKSVTRALGIPYSTFTPDPPAKSSPNQNRKSGGVIRSRSQVIFYSKLVIFALNDALNTVSDTRLHNHPPSELIVDDDQYIDELRNLVAELKRLNDLLDRSGSIRTKAKKASR
jgi:transcriptional regulator with XRE-family HTH domain